MITGRSSEDRGVRGEDLLMSVGVRARVVGGRVIGGAA